MSNPSQRSSPIRARTSAAILIIALTAVSAVAIAQSLSLKWTLAEQIQSVMPTRNPNPAISSILVNATTSSCTANLCFLPSKNHAFDISGALVIVRSPGGRNGLIVDSALTNFTGEAFFTVTPGLYEVTVSSNYGNASAPVSTATNYTTDLSIWENDTQFHCTYFQFSNSFVPGTITPWDKMYLAVPSGTLIGRAIGEQDYLELNYFQLINQHFSELSISSPPIGFHIVTEYYSPSQSTLWLVITLDQSMSASNLTSIALFTYVPSITTKEFPMPVQSTIITGTTGGLQPP